jgi:hypothetical protein
MDDPIAVTPDHAPAPASAVLQPTTDTVEPLVPLTSSNPEAQAQFGGVAFDATQTSQPNASPSFPTLAVLMSVGLVGAVAYYLTEHP